MLTAAVDAEITPRRDADPGVRQHIERKPLAVRVKGAAVGIDVKRTVGLYRNRKAQPAQRGNDVIAPLTNRFCASLVMSSR